VLSERQLEHVHAWIKECVPSRKISELCRTEFQKKIPHMTFVRYAHRFEPFRHLHGLTDSKEAAKEISQYTATGNPSFSVNTLELLEQQAFDLALAHQRDADAADLHTLEKLWTLIHKAKSTQIRERHATVQERKCDLRAKELELKHHLATARLNNSGGASPARSASLSSVLASTSPTSNSRDAAAQTDAAQADQETNTTPSSTQDSALITNPFEPICSLSPEVRAENQRYAELLLSGQIKTHYKRDPANSLLAKICNWPMPPASAQTTATTQCSADSLSASTKSTDTENPTTNSNDQPGAQTATPNENQTPDTHILCAEPSANP
jgi:hypothetical protein